MGALERRVVWGIVGGVVVYAALGLWTDANAVWGELSRVSGWVCAGALGLSVVNYSVRFLKWQVYLGCVGVEGVGWLESLNVFVAGMVMSVTPGKVGEVLKSALLAEEFGLEVERTAPIVVAERLTDLLGLLLLAGLGVASFEYGRAALGVSAAVVFGGVVILSTPRVVLGGLEVLGRWERLREMVGRLERAYESMLALLEWRVLVGTTLMSAVSWGMEGIAFWWLVREVGAVDFEVARAVFLFSTTTVLGALSFLPGGLGVTEAGMIGGLMAMGVFATQVKATLATYLIRLSTLWFGVVCGLVALLVFRARQAFKR
ncbi:MAG: lysylphosphatidylglycerol synthase transmembrane domain-containing protein [Myxococcota bacterium]